MMQKLQKTDVADIKEIMFTVFIVDTLNVNNSYKDAKETLAKTGKEAFSCPQLYNNV